MASCDFAYAAGKSPATPMTSPVDFISGPEHRVGAREAPERHDRLLDAEARRARGRRLGRSISASFSPAMTRAATFASGTPVALLTNGTVRLARGLTSST